MTIAPTVAQPQPQSRELAPDVVAEQARVKQAAVARSARHRLFVIGIRAVSLAIVHVAWQVGVLRVESVLFTPPTAVDEAAIQMVASGEMWGYLWPSLVVLV